MKSSISFLFTKPHLWGCQGPLPPACVPENKSHFFNKNSPLFQKQPININSFCHEWRNKVWLFKKELPFRQTAAYRSASPCRSSVYGARACSA